MMVVGFGGGNRPYFSLDARVTLIDRLMLTIRQVLHID